MLQSAELPVSCSCKYIIRLPIGLTNVGRLKGANHGPWATIGILDVQYLVYTDVHPCGKLWHRTRADGFANVRFTHTHKHVTPFCKPAEQCIFAPA